MFHVERFQLWIVTPNPGGSASFNPRPPINSANTTHFPCEKEKCKKSKVKSDKANNCTPLHCSLVHTSFLVLTRLNCLTTLLVSWELGQSIAGLGESLGGAKDSWVRFHARTLKAASENYIYGRSRMTEVRLAAVISTRDAAASTVYTAISDKPKSPSKSNTASLHALYLTYSTLLPLNYML